MSRRLEERGGDLDEDGGDRGRWPREVEVGDVVLGPGTWGRALEVEELGSVV